MSYFDHDYKSRNDDKILELRAEFGAEGYGVWWMLLETIAESGGIDKRLIGGLSLGYGVAKDRLLAIIEFCEKIGLLYGEPDGLTNKRMQVHIERMQMYSDAGKKGAEKRWKNRGAINGAIGEGNANKSKEEKIKEEEIILKDSLSHARESSKPSSIDEVYQLAEICAVPKQVAVIFFERGTANGWVTAVGSNIVPVHDWRALFRSRCKMIESDLRKQTRNLGGKTPDVDDFQQGANNMRNVIDSIFEEKEQTRLLDAKN